MNGLLSLKWNNHSAALLRKLKNLLTRDSYADATIVCHGTYFPVHRLVLSTCSEYFEEIFENTRCKHPFIIVKDIDAVHLEALLNYMYRGEVNVLQDVLPGLIKAAESLKIKGLAVPDDPDEDEELIENKRSLSPGPVQLHKRLKKTRYRNSANKSDRSSPVHIESRESPIRESVNSNSNPEIEFIRTDIKLEPVEDSDVTAEKVQEPKDIASTEDIDVKPNVESCRFDSMSPEQSHSDKESTLSSDIQLESPHIFMTNNQLQRHNNGKMNDSPSLFSSHHLEESNSLFNLSNDEGEINGIEGTITIAKCQWSYCTFSHSDNTIMESHLSSQHSGPKPYYCALCDFHSSTAIDLKNHLYSTHPGERLFQCYLCQYRADSFSNVVKHVRVHTGEKPFSCQYCNYRTTQNNNLYRHIRSHHGIPA